MCSGPGTAGGAHVGDNSGRPGPLQASCCNRYMYIYTSYWKSESMAKCACVCAHLIMTAVFRPEERACSEIALIQTHLHEKCPN